MGALLFTIKSVILTILLIAVLQIQWNGESFENKLSKYSRETGVLNIADTTAKGIIRLVENNFDFDFQEDEFIDQNEDLVQAAKLGFNQSEVYMSKKSETAKRAIEKFRRELKENKQKSDDVSSDVSSEEIY